MLFGDIGHKFPDVIFLDSKGRTVFLEDPVDVEIGDGTIVEPCIQLTGKIKIGKNCKLKWGLNAHNLECGDDCELSGQITNSKFGNGCRLGRFAEINRCSFGDAVNCLHHCYLGDTTVGDGANIAAGVITANFDGEKKKRTIIAPGAFVGVNVNLIAPVVIGKESLIAAGSTITQDISSHALAVCRSRKLIIRENFWKKVGKIWKKMITSDKDSS